jgi:hypothetical protein
VCFLIQFSMARLKVSSLGASSLLCLYITQAHPQKFVFIVVSISHLSPYAGIVCELVYIGGNTCAEGILFYRLIVFTV